MNTLDKRKTRQAHRIQLPVREPLGKISCPRCGNSAHFVERLESVMVTAPYLQNTDGSFTLVEQSSDIGGEMAFLCGECGYDLTSFHAHFREMAF